MSIQGEKECRELDLEQKVRLWVRSTVPIQSVSLHEGVKRRTSGSLERDFQMLFYVACNILN